MPSACLSPTKESCVACQRRGAKFFCEMAAPALHDIDAVKSLSTYPQGAVIFIERQQPRGVYLICEGQVKLTMSSIEGKTLILRIASAGEVLGLAPVLSGTPHQLTAEALRPCKVAFIRRDDFLKFLPQHPEVYRSVVAQMGSQYRTACEQIRTLGLNTSVPQRVARLLLNWAANAPISGHNSASGARTTMPLTHEEIAEFVGTTRESVTRALSDFKRRQLIELHGSMLTIPSCAALEQCVNA